MKNSIFLKEGENCFLITFKNFPSYITIFDGDKKLRQKSILKQVKKFKYYTNSGQYFVETDGAIEKVETNFFDLTPPLFINLIEIDSTGLPVFFIIGPGFPPSTLSISGLKERNLSLDQLKQALQTYFTKLSSEEEKKLLPNRTLLCALLDNDQKQIARINATRKKINNESKRLSTLINKIKTIENLERLNFTPKFPKKMAIVRNNSNTPKR